MFGIIGWQRVDAGNGRATVQPVLSPAALEQMRREYEAWLRGICEK